MPSPTFITEIDPTADVPRAFLLEVWRKVQRAIDHYFDRRRIARPDDAAALERLLENDSAMGEHVVVDMRALRAEYDHIEHARTAHIPSAEAKQFVARAFRITRVLLSQGPNAV